jgi:hypothetical protein
MLSNERRNGGRKSNLCEQAVSDAAEKFESHHVYMMTLCTKRISQRQCRTSRTP